MEKYNLTRWFAMIAKSLLVLGAVTVATVPFNAFAIPLHVQGPVSYNDALFSSFFGDAATANVTIYGPGVKSDPGETRFVSNVTSAIGPGDLTYFINLTFNTSFVIPTRFEVIIPSGPVLPVITAAGIVGGDPASILTTIDRLRFNFGSAPLSDIDLFIISRYLPNSNQLIGTSLDYQGGLGNAVASLLLPDDQPVAMPEPGTLLLLGSGLVALAGFGRKKLMRKN